MELKEYLESIISYLNPPSLVMRTNLFLWPRWKFITPIITTESIITLPQKCESNVLVNSLINNAYNTLGVSRRREGLPA